MRQSQSKLSRRTVFAGAGTVGVVAAVAGLIPSTDKPQPASAQPKVAPTRGGGYSLTDHVKRYYKTARV
ncbi:MAG: formate dehydrogenase [Rhodoferax sp.]